jgi:hypothetical protein
VSGARGDEFVTEPTANEPAEGKPERKRRSRPSCLQILGILLLGIVLIAALAGWWVKYNVYASPFDPTNLSESEKEVLEAKMARLSDFQPPSRPDPADLDTGPGPKAEPYSEDDAKREIRVTERELNALIDRNPDWVEHVGVDLDNDLVSVVVLVPFDEDFPVVGGVTARITAGITLRYENEKPVVILRGVSIGGVPLPSAWMGDIKNKDLVREFDREGGFWDQFSKGVEDIQIREGYLYLKLKE